MKNNEITVVLAGATGLVGSEVLRRLLQEAAVKEIITYTRKPLPLSHTKIREVMGELSEMSRHKEELRGNVFISCLGTTIKTAGSKENFRAVDFEGVVSFARIARETGAKKFITVSSSGANPDSIIFYQKVKGQTERALRELKFPSLTIFQPSLLVGDRDENRPGEKLAISVFRAISPIIPEGLDRRLGTRVGTLASMIVRESTDLSEGSRTVLPGDIV